MMDKMRINIYIKDVEGNNGRLGVAGWGSYEGCLPDEMLWNIDNIRQLFYYNI